MKRLSIVCKGDGVADYCECCGDEVFCCFKCNEPLHEDDKILCVSALCPEDRVCNVCRRHYCKKCSETLMHKGE